MYGFCIVHYDLPLKYNIHISREKKIYTSINYVVWLRCIISDMCMCAKRYSLIICIHCMPSSSSSTYTLTGVCAICGTFAIIERSKFRLCVVLRAPAAVFRIQNISAMRPKKYIHTRLDSKRCAPLRDLL